MGQIGSSRIGRVATSVVGAIPTGIVSYVIGRITEKSGLLDPVADTAGLWLKTNVSPSTAGLVISLIVFGGLYGLLLWLVWRPRHIHHLPIQAETRPEASLGIEVRRAVDATAPPESGSNWFGSAAITQQYDLMSLKDAATRVYSELRRGVERLADHHTPWTDQQKALGLYAGLIAGEDRMPIWGKHPPSNWVERVPKDDIRKLAFSDDATALVEQSDCRQRWVDLQIDKADYAKRLLELREAYGS